MAREPRLRRATASDAAAIAAIQVDTWRIAYAHAFPSEYLEGLSVDERRDLWTRTLSSGTFDVFVAELEGRVAGFVCPAPRRTRPHRVSCSRSTSSPQHGERGRAERYSSAQRRLRDADFDTTVLWVLEDNPRARGLYETAGWSADGGRKRLPHGGVDAIAVRYRKRLRL